MKRLLLIFTALTISLLFVDWPTNAQGSPGYQVIVHQTNPTSSLTKDQVGDFLLKKTSRWTDGTPAEPVDLDSDSPVRAAMSEDIHGRSVINIKNYWQRQIFSGRNVPPPEVANDAAVIDFVRSRPGAIGYVSPGANVSSVKALRVVD